MRKIPLFAGWLVAAALLLLLVGGGAVHWRQQAAKAGFTDLLRRMQGLQPLVASKQVPCAAVSAQAPLVVLVLGQSNAANHGIRSAGLPHPITVINSGVCGHSQEPLPGATGSGSSFAASLPQALRARGETRPIVVALLAVDASSLNEWTAPKSPLRARLAETLAANRAAGLQPHWVLWQQGEADARAQISQADYEAGLQALSQELQRAQVTAPVLLARSTVCRSSPYGAVRQAMESVSKSHPARFVLGPDADTALSPHHRHDGCHLNDLGLETLTQLWAASLIQPTAALR